MAACTSRLLILLSVFLVILLRSHFATSSFHIRGGGEDVKHSYHNYEDDDDDDDSQYILDAPLNQTTTTTSRLRSSRFLASIIIKKGTRCSTYPKTENNVCNGVSANNGTSLLYCCKKHCRNVFGDWNNCGGCGHRCKMNEKCCKGRCVDILFNPYNCGRCNRKCFAYERCEYGICGYD